MQMVNLTIDGKQIQAPAGSSVLEAARSAGIDAREAGSVAEALKHIAKTSPTARVLVMYCYVKARLADGGM